MDDRRLLTRNKWTFGLGTFGRDMTYTFISMFMIFFLTEVADLSDAVLTWTSVLMLTTRLVDAGLDLVMGMIVDNTETRWGAYKPWMAAGLVLSSLFTALLFADLGSDATFVVLFFLVYLLWSLSWTMNDIPYWSLLPVLTFDQHRREEIGSVAKTAGTAGTFLVVIAVLPATGTLGDLVGSRRLGWMLFALIIITIMLAFQALTLFGVREPGLVTTRERTTLKGLFQAVRGNDQLLWTSLSMVMFTTGFITTTSFGTYFFKYAYRNEKMYSVFALVLAGSQLAGLISFPAIARCFSRASLYRFAIMLVVIGYVVFFFSPMNIVVLACAGVPMFLGDAFIVLLMLMFLSDTVEYGQWKLGRRNTALTFAVQPFIYKVSGALATQIVAITTIVSGINAADDPKQVTQGGLWLMKIMMLVVPLLMIVGGYLIFRRKFVINAEYYDRIVRGLKERGDLV